MEAVVVAKLSAFASVAQACSVWLGGGGQAATACGDGETQLVCLDAAGLKVADLQRALQVKIGGHDGQRCGSWFGCGFGRWLACTPGRGWFEVVIGIELVDIECEADRGWRETSDVDLHGELAGIEFVN